MEALQTLFSSPHLWMSKSSLDLSNYSVHSLLRALVLGLLKHQSLHLFSFVLNNWKSAFSVISHPGKVGLKKVQLVRDHSQVSQQLPLIWDLIPRSCAEMTRHITCWILGHCPPYSPEYSVAKSTSVPWVTFPHWSHLGIKDLIQWNWRYKLTKDCSL